jgi:uncharacterized protein (DUF2235 family)
MSKNIVVCCDGTGNQIDANLSNVLKLFRVIRKDADQVAFYDPGLGTISNSDPWSRWKNNALGVWGLLTGYGLDENILGAYRFLIESYQKGDRVFLFGFSRGAYTIRVLAGFLHLVGLLNPAQRNLCGYALTAYKRAAEKDDLPIAWRFERVASTRHISINFMGVWDTVSSVIVPRPDRFYLPSLEMLPYTRKNPSVEVFRHAIAIDERRRMFRPNTWLEPQVYQPNPFDKRGARPQDVKQVWFAGVHADIGGGYSEAESATAKFPLKWVIDEAVTHGLRINRAMYNHLVLGRSRKGSAHNYVAPGFTEKLHNSMSGGWPSLEVIPKRTRWRDWSGRCSFFGWYLPQCEPRRVDEGALIHRSVLDRMKASPSYRPVNLPPLDNVRIEGATASVRPGGPAVDRKSANLVNSVTRWLCMAIRGVSLALFAASTLVVLAQTIWWLRYGTSAAWKLVVLWDWAESPHPHANWVGVDKILWWILERPLWIALAVVGAVIAYSTALSLGLAEKYRLRRAAVHQLMDRTP